MNGNSIYSYGVVPCTCGRYWRTSTSGTEEPGEAQYLLSLWPAQWSALSTWGPHWCGFPETLKVQTLFKADQADQLINLEASQPGWGKCSWCSIRLNILLEATAFTKSSAKVRLLALFLFAMKVVQDVWRLAASTRLELCVCVLVLNSSQVFPHGPLHSVFLGRRPTEHIFPATQQLQSSSLKATLPAVQNYLTSNNA